MFEINWRRAIGNLITRFATLGVILGLILGMGGCGQKPLVVAGERPPQTVAKGISEVSPPEVIQELKRSLEDYQPQVSIVSPKPGAVLKDTTVSVEFQVADLPLFKNPELGMGPHLHVILDNEPYKAVYDLSQPLVFKDLAPGTHTLRAFASRPWHESFKNEGAYDQVTFHLFAQTPENNPDPAQPVLTYSRPKGSYGAEPIMLDFYLTNAPLHLAAQTNPDDNIVDWRIRCTINGASFVLDRWQPIYLKGFKPGDNWVQLEYLDEQGNLVQNRFNSTVRLINYDPAQQDTLSKLMRGDLQAADARGIVDPNYVLEKQPAVEVAPTPAAAPVLPSVTPSLEPSPVPTPEPSLQPEIPVPPATPVPSPTPTPEVPDQLEAQEEPTPAIAPTPAEAKPAKPSAKPSEGFFGRLRSRFNRSTPPSPSLPTQLPEVIEAPEPETLPETAPEPIFPLPEPSLKPTLPESPPKSDRFPEEMPAQPQDLTNPPPLPEIRSETSRQSEPDLDAFPPAPTINPPQPSQPSQPPGRKLNLRKIFAPKAAQQTDVPIIKPPTQPEVPSRYLRHEPEAPTPQAVPSSQLEGQVEQGKRIHKK